MKRWKAYKIYGEDSCDVYRMIVPSPTKKEAEDLVVLVNGSGVKKSYKFKDGDTVVFLSPAGGG